MFWYVFTEMFEHYRPFYTFAFQYHPFLYTLPLYYRLRRHPVFLFWALVAVITALKAYPSVGDFSLSMAVLPLLREQKALPRSMPPVWHRLR